MMNHDDHRGALLQNSERITTLFEKYAMQFEKKNMPDLADRWRRILINYKRAVNAKMQQA